MTQEEFVAVIKQVVFDPAVGEEALRPVGRKPHEVLVRMWDWYTSLPDYDKAMVRQAMRIAAYGAIFGFFAALDGSRSIDDPLTQVDPAGAGRKTPNATVSASSGMCAVTSCVHQSASFAIVPMRLLGSASAPCAVKGPWPVG